MIIPREVNRKIRREHRKIYPDKMQFDRNYLCFSGWLRIKFKCDPKWIVHDHYNKYWEYMFNTDKDETIFKLRFSEYL